MKNIYKSELSDTIKLAAPVSIGQLGHIAMGVVDSMMVGQVGAVPLAAASLVTGIFFLILVIGFGVAFAVTPLTAIAKGSGDNEECGTVLREGFILNFFIGIILFAVLYFAADFLRFLNQPPDVTREAAVYLRVLSFSVIPMLLFQNHRSFSEGLSFVSPPMYIAIFANFANAFFNWILIFGNLGFPALGLKGAGIATLFTRSLMMIAMLVYIHKSERFKIYLAGFFSKKTDIKLMKKILEIGLPSGFQYFFEVAAFSFAAVMIGWIGSYQLAAHQIAINLSSVTYMVILGISSAGSIRVAEAYGMKSAEKVRRAGFSALAISAGFTLITASLFFTLRGILPTFYNDNENVLALASQLLIIAGFFQIFDGAQATDLGILRGMKDTKKPLLVTVFAYWVIGIPVGYYLAFKLNYGAVGVWIGLTLGLAIVGILLTLRFHLKTNRLFLNERRTMDN
ncbi:MAG: MATE family efflux transporter [Chlorobi bacterium]|nr:MATE family efflux transporter [Chlorobiota bacterium]